MAGMKNDGRYTVKGRYLTTPYKNYFTKGKVYTVRNGAFLADNGVSYYYSKSYFNKRLINKNIVGGKILW